MVLDPFGGSGTTGYVADKLGRNATLIELNPQYIEIAENRIDPPEKRLDPNLFEIL
jgi:DNA modification methylase